MDDDFFRREYDHGTRGKDNLFLWTVFILLLIGAAMACWLGSFYIFGHPENPRSYSILLKLKKLDPPKRFELTAAPAGEFLTPQKLYEKYSTMPDYELQQENAKLLRDYIKNYQDTKKLVPYLIGRFKILDSHELKEKDIFPSGVVALAQATNYPQVLVEHVYTAEPQTVGSLQKMLTPGLDIRLEKTLDLSAIIHIEKLDDGRLQLTAVPLLYGSYALKQGSGGFSLEPPSQLHLEGGVPILKPAALPSAGRNYVAAPKTSPTPGENGAAPAETPSMSELVRVMAPVVVSTPKPSKNGTPSPTPAVAAAETPAPTPMVAEATPTPIPEPVAVPTASLFTVNTLTPTPRPTGATPTPVAAVTSPTPAAGSATSTPAPAVAAEHPDVALQPFIEAKPTPPLANVTGSWKTYKPGQMPRGRLLKVPDASALVEKGTGGERLYLSGQFVVTASGDNRAVLRSKGGILNNLNPLDKSTVRILVEFPAGYVPPAEGSSVSRDDQRPFEIRDIQRARDGTVNVYVREVTTPD